MCHIADECAAVAMAVRGAAFTTPAAASVSMPTLDKLLLDTLSHTRFDSPNHQPLCYSVNCSALLIGCHLYKLLLDMLSHTNFKYFDPSVYK